MILNFTEEPTINKEYYFIQPLSSEPEPFTATLLQYGRMGKKDWRDRDQFYGIFLLNGEKRKAEIDWHGWYNGGDGA